MDDLKKDLKTAVSSKSYFEELTEIDVNFVSGRGIVTIINHYCVMVKPVQQDCRRHIISLGFGQISEEITKMLVCKIASNDNNPSKEIRIDARGKGWIELPPNKRYRLTVILR